MWAKRIAYNRGVAQLIFREKSASFLSDSLVGILSGAADGKVARTLHFLLSPLR